MATTIEWYQRSVRDYEDQVRDYSADLSFLNEQIQTANNSIADLRRQRSAAAGNDEQQQLLTDQINNVTSRRNGLELRQADASNALQSAQSSLAQAQRDLARVSQGESAPTPPPPSAPRSDPEVARIEIEEDQEGGAIGIPRDTNNTPDPFEVDGANIGETEAAVAEPEPLDDRFSPYGEPNEELEIPEVSAPEPVNENPWAGRDDEKAAAWEQLSPEDQQWLGDADPTDEIILSRAPNGGQPQSALDRPRDQIDPQPDPYEVDGADIGLTEEERQQQDNPTTQQSEAQIRAAQQRAQAQAAMARQRAQASQGDWRVKLRLAGAADYLYRAANPGILAPLAVTDGVIFPYTPTITVAHSARYNSYDLTHSNLRGYFYEGSHVEPIQIMATFTAQDTAEADYVLAVIQFFRSVTKMFYGQDANRGVPPPLVFLQGLGQFQYNLHPCVVQSFGYTTPTDVDYIRAGVTTISGAGFLRARQRQTTTATGGIFGTIERLQSLGQNIQPGAQTQPPAPPTIGTQDPTYVPTKMDINVTLLPMQTREQISQQFSLDKFANGDLVKGGFW